MTNRTLPNTLVACYDLISFLRILPEDCDAFDIFDLEQLHSDLACCIVGFLSENHWKTESLFDQKISLVKSNN